MKKLTILFVLILSAGAIFSQSISIPLELKKAYINKTRSEDGKPGVRYWQNKSAYAITVQLIPETRTLNGSEKITYVNNSPDTLHEIVVRLYQDIYKKNAIRDFEIDARDATDGVHLQSISVDGETYKTTDSARFAQYGTNFSLFLKHPLLTKSSLELAIDWNTTLSAYRNIRTGTYDSTIFFVGYWYPQVAVYDDIYGWDRLIYGGQTEFYNDFNDFDVKIHVPKNYLVWGTGLLQNKEEIFNKATLDKLKTIAESDSLFHLTVPEKYNELFENNTDHVFHLTAEHVPDFAFSASNKLYWDARSVMVDSIAKRRALIQAIYPVVNEEEMVIANTAANILQTFSFTYPAVAYPFPSMTVFVNKGVRGGMEFPMIVNDGMPPDHRNTVALTAHEIAHTYFPFYMGINERRYAWMDEGWATNFPFDLIPGSDSTASARESNVKGYAQVAGTSMDVPLLMQSCQINGTTYRNASYAKPACMYDILSDIVGKERFTKALQSYIAAWNGKHPQPHDFINCMNSALGEDFNWYWHPWLVEFAFPNLALSEVTLDKNTAHVLIEKKGQIPVPVDITVIYHDGSQVKQHFTAAVWEEIKLKSFDIAIAPDKQVKKIILGNKEVPDINKKDNTWEPGNGH